jgi:hypothetical protein
MYSLQIIPVRKFYTSSHILAHVIYFDFLIRHKNSLKFWRVKLQSDKFHVYIILFKFGRRRMLKFQWKTYSQLTHEGMQQLQISRAARKSDVSTFSVKQFMVYICICSYIYI